MSALEQRLRDELRNEWAFIDNRLLMREAADTLAALRKELDENVEAHMANWSAWREKVEAGHRAEAVLAAVRKWATQGHLHVPGGRCYFCEVLVILDRSHT